MSKTIILDSFSAECLKNNLLNTFLFKMLFRNLFFQNTHTHTHTHIGLSPDNRMANQVSKAFISHPVIFLTWNVI